MSVVNLYHAANIELLTIKVINMPNNESLHDRIPQLVNEFGSGKNGSSPVKALCSAIAKHPKEPQWIMVQKRYSPNFVLSPQNLPLLKQNLHKITFLLIAFMAIIFCACSSDDDNEPTHSRFVYSDKSIVVSISGKQNFGITIYKERECVYQNLHYVTISGDYPIYTYTYENYGIVELRLTCTYSNPSTFTAVVESSNIIGQGISPNYEGENISLPSTMLFKVSNKPADQNGDGILDE